jgi:hypothetical protein
MLTPTVYEIARGTAHPAETPAGRRGAAGATGARLSLVGRDTHRGADLSGGGAVRVTAMPARAAKLAASHGGEPGVIGGLGPGALGQAAA